MQRQLRATDRLLLQRDGSRSGDRVQELSRLRCVDGVLVRYVGQHAQHNRVNEERHGRNSHKPNSHGSRDRRHARHAGIHTVRYLHVHRAPKEADISLRVGGVRPLPHAFHAIAPYHQHRHHAHPRCLEVHRYQVSSRASYRGSFVFIGGNEFRITISDGRSSVSIGGCFNRGSGYFVPSVIQNSMAFPFQYEIQ